MTVSFTKNPPKPPITPPVKRGRGRPPKNPNSPPDRKTIKKQQRREKNIAAFKQANYEISEEFKKEMAGRNIPATVKEAIEKRTISAQEIIEVWEELWQEKLGPCQRKFVVANFFADQAILTKAPKANEYSPEVATMILNRMCNGESLTHICADPYMPSPGHFFRWVGDNEKLRDQYANAQQALVEMRVMNAYKEATSARVGVTVTNRADGSTDIQTYDNVARSRLVVDFIKWDASKINKGKYGPSAPMEGGAGQGNGQGMPFRLINDPLADDTGGE
jgi:hypothetical protein